MYNPLDQFEIVNLISVYAFILGNKQLTVNNIGLYMTVSLYIAISINIITTNYDKIISNKIAPKSIPLPYPFVKFTNKSIIGKDFITILIAGMAITIPKSALSIVKNFGIAFLLGVPIFQTFTVYAQPYNLPNLNDVFPDNIDIAHFDPFALFHPQFPHLRLPDVFNFPNRDMPVETLIAQRDEALNILPVWLETIRLSQNFILYNFGGYDLYLHYTYGINPYMDCTHLENIPVQDWTERHHELNRLLNRHNGLYGGTYRWFEQVVIIDDILNNTNYYDIYGPTRPYLIETAEGPATRFQALINEWHSLIMTFILRRRYFL